MAKIIDKIKEEKWWLTAAQGTVKLFGRLQHLKSSRSYNDEASGKVAPHKNETNSTFNLFFSNIRIFL